MFFLSVNRCACLLYTRRYLYIKICASPGEKGDMREQLFHTAGCTEMQAEWWCVFMFLECMWKANESEVGNIALANWGESDMSLFVRILKTWFRDCFVFIWIQFRSDEGWINLWMFVCGYFRPCHSHASSWNVNKIFGKTTSKRREMHVGKLCM